MSGMIESVLALIFNQSPEGRTLIARVCSGIRPRRTQDRIEWSCVEGLLDSDLSFNPFPATEIERALGPCADRPSIARASSVGCRRKVASLQRRRLVKECRRAYEQAGQRKVGAADTEQYSLCFSSTRCCDVRLGCQFLSSTCLSGFQLYFARSLLNLLDLLSTAAARCSSACLFS